MSESELDAGLESLLSRCVVVLVKTTHSGNIGAVARACKTMGITHLRLVSPVADIDDDAVRRASGADDVLAQAEIYRDLQAAVADCHMVVGASARSRSMVWPVASPRDIAQDVYRADGGFEMKVVSGEDAGLTTALVFGQEASGLSNEELHLCHRHVCIPANPAYSSLNLAMAVQVVCYEMRMAAMALVERTVGVSPAAGAHSAVLDADAEGWDEPRASHSEVEGMLQHLEQTLIAIAYHDPENPRMLMPRLRRLFQRCKMDKIEVNIMRGICKSILGKIAKDNIPDKNG